MRTTPHHRVAACCGLLALLLGCVAPLAAAEPPLLFEFSGVIELPKGSLPPRRHITLILLPVGEQTFRQSWADGRGNFRFKKVKAGVYSLTIQIPTVGEITETVDVTPSFADARGRVFKKFSYDQEALEKRVRERQQGLVSVRELTIPESARLEFQRARDRLRRGKTDDAVKILSKLVQRVPQYAEALNTLGVIAFERRDFPAAEQFFRQALEKSPEAFEPLVNLGGVLLATGKAEEALEVNGRAQEMRPEDPLANAQLGFSHLLNGDPDQAAIYLEWTEDIDPAHFTNPQLALARIYLRKDDAAQAAEELEQFLQFHPDAPEAGEARSLLERVRRIQQERAQANGTDAAAPDGETGASETGEAAN